VSTAIPATGSTPFSVRSTAPAAIPSSFRCATRRWRRSWRARAGGDPEFIQVRHEEMAAFMACGHAKFTGDVGVCIATSGPGAIHLLNGLYDAKLDHQP